jgi:hypothetical protein
MSERERCSGCDKRRVVARWFHVGGVVMGLLFPVCRQCLKDGWEPQLGRDYNECSEEEWDAEFERVIRNAVATGQLP